jgi:hypothetical protein
MSDLQHSQTICDDSFMQIVLVKLQRLDINSMSRGKHCPHQECLFSPENIVIFHADDELEFLANLHIWTYFRIMSRNEIPVVCDLMVCHRQIDFTVKMLNVTVLDTNSHIWTCFCHD